VDRSDIIFGIEQEVDYIAASFVRSADDIKILRDVLAANGGEEIKIISKIENRGGVNNLDEIIEVSDGVMVARGDLGVEIPFTELPAIQKEMIHKCLVKGKIVITATQMLESMITNPRPTRAEVSDIANAIYDGTTAIMLSGESAAGAYPIESVKTMAEIALETEKGIDYDRRFKKHHLEVKPGFMNTISFAACSASFQIGAKAIISVSISGRTIEALSHYHTSCPIIAEVVDERALRQLNLAWNVKPVKAERKFSTDELFESAIQWAKATGLVEDGDVAIITSSAAIGQPETNVMKLQKL
jgi:pyruvate kinase